MKDGHVSTNRDRDFEALLEYLKRTRGYDLSGYKRAGLVRRVLKRIQAVSLATYTDYMDYLEVHPEEFAFLFNTILINVTEFFRDQPAWDYLNQQIIPRILEQKVPEEPIRIWSAGCASGEEAYSVAILLTETLGPEVFRQRVKIYATDVDDDALTQARQGSYSQKDLQAVPAELRDKYFELTGSRYIFRADLRRSIIFGRHDLVQDAPISRLDLLLCRNTMIYLNAETQTRILARFHFALAENGFLFLGKAEMLLTHGNLFQPVELKYRIFTKTPNITMRDRLLVLVQAGDTDALNHLGRHVRLRDATFECGPAAQVVVDLNATLIMANERARLLFKLSPRELGRRFQDLELAYRPIELHPLIERACSERCPVKIADVHRIMPDDTVQYLDVLVTPLQDSGGVMLGVSITFDDVSERHRLQAELQRSTQELETASEELQSTHEELITTNEELQSTNEELETTNEELQSTNEELETTNEELQSTNEELETMNEELQATNEELQTINEELRQRTGELNKNSTFFRSILTSLRVAVIVVDTEMCVLIWNEWAQEMWGRRADEVLGQSLLSLEIGLPVEHLPISAFLAGKAGHQRITMPATTRYGKQIQCSVTCTPFFSEHDERGGMILIMEEVPQ